MVTFREPTAKADYAFHQGKLVNPFWILLDNKLTTDIFYKQSLLRNICKSKGVCEVNTNTGLSTTNLIANLLGYHQTVWFDPNGITNILSLKHVRERTRVTYNSHEGENANTFVVHVPDRQKLLFEMHTHGLFYHNIPGKKNPILTQYSSEDKRRCRN